MIDKKVEFHKGDFFLGDQLLFTNDGNTERYFHFLGSVDDSLENMNNYRGLEKIEQEFNDAELALYRLKKALESVSLPIENPTVVENYKIGDVKYSSHYGK